MKLENNKALKIIILGIIVVLIVLGVSYVINQLTLNSKSRELILGNAEKVSTSEEKFTEMKEAVSFIAKASTLQELNQSNTKLTSETASFKDYVNNIQIPDGINIASNNSKQTATAQLQSLSESSDAIKNLYAAKVCYLTEIESLKKFDADLQALNEKYAATIEYINASKVLQNMVKKYNELDTFKANFIKCSDKYSVASSSEIEEIIENDKTAADSFASGYLNPLIDLYAKQNSVDINNFIDKNYDTKGKIALGYPNILTKEYLATINNDFQDELDNI